MRVVIDTNVVISGTFFGGNPRHVIEVVVDGAVDASASVVILEEYDEVVREVYCIAHTVKGNATKL